MRCYGAKLRIRKKSVQKLVYNCTTSGGPVTQLQQKFSKRVQIVYNLSFSNGPPLFRVCYTHPHPLAAQQHLGCPPSHFQKNQSCSMSNYQNSTYIPEK